MSDERYVTLAEVEDLLESEGKERELGQEQKLSLDHSRKMRKLPVKQAKALQKDLEELEFVSEAIACKIVDILPKHPDDVRILFAKERLILEKKHIDQILAVVGKYL
ncbi:MAG: hypothetical protein FJ088_16510, partial [Deltaproteobacteria bacterium]|nr:hypothetical protein [Deltaproteobacteria bacterium]